MEKYKPEECECCGQTKTYLLAIDRGTVDIVKAMASAIKKKGINVIHPRNEMEMGKGKAPHDVMVQEGFMTSNMVGNLSRPCRHGLIAHIEGNPGNYCLTGKGIEFLRGMFIPKYAIISKVEGCQIGYFNPDVHLVSVNDFLKSDEYWDGIDFVIEAGRVVHDVPAKGQIV